MPAGTWLAERVPEDTVGAVRANVGSLVEGIVSAVRAENPVYAEVLGSPEGIGIRLGIEQAIKSFLDAVQRDEHPPGDTAEVWRRLGEAEFQSGRSLEALRAAWRTGTRAAWRGSADLAAAAGIPAPTVITLAEAIFVYTDELATDVVEGYLRVQSDEAGERERRRRRLASLLLDTDNHDPEAIEHAAELARWPLPRAVAVLALETDEPGGVTRRLDIDALVGSDGIGAWLVLPDPDGPRRQAALRRALGQTRASLGPSVAPYDAGRSLRWARMALELVQRGALPAQAPTHAPEHLAAMIVAHDGEMARALVERQLAPLADLPGPERERLIETLRAWLDHQRHTPGIAAQLHVHPQTVRYRLGKLRELLGEELDNPDGRFKLELALRARETLGDPDRPG